MILHINIRTQTLSLNSTEHDQVFKTYKVSTSKFGVGEENNSFKTPRGTHCIRAKIGADEPINTVFIGRRPTGEIFGEALLKSFPDRDWILTRILWLSGKEVGINRLGTVDTMRRYIYIHGSPDGVQMGVPGSIGCIRMRNSDVIDLFDRVSVGDSVQII
ncbi:MAG: L,D-transpeptidase [Burkholderiales bacterium]|nr:L,D-transpeptidase [Burkholderiales bacterium]OUT78507.1 MAG: L,D-transpeptidase [Betaproteobacteria bacterium TMED22]|tara:strand:+ start:5578 stop:6057 length:480 start_codon:yes stop_codon:yes gene_type:complete